MKAEDKIRKCRFCDKTIYRVERFWTVKQFPPHNLLPVWINCQSPNSPNYRHSPVK